MISSEVVGKGKAKAFEAPKLQHLNASAATLALMLDYQPSRSARQQMSKGRVEDFIAPLIIIEAFDSQKSVCCSR